MKMIMCLKTDAVRWNDVLSGFSHVVNRISDAHRTSRAQTDKPVALGISAGPTGGKLSCSVEPKP